jgi:hypothetical protein
MRRATVEEIAEQILRYLSKHPQAEDTAEGILRWWVMEEQLEEAASTVREALVSLVVGGNLFVVVGGDGSVRYRLRKPSEEGSQWTSNA